MSEVWYAVLCEPGATLIQKGKTICDNCGRRERLVDGELPPGWRTLIRKGDAIAHSCPNKHCLAIIDLWMSGGFDVFPKTHGQMDLFP